MSNPNPPKEHQFPRHRQNHTQKGPYLAPILKKMLSRNYRCQDPETNEFKKISGSKGVMLVLVWEALQGNTDAIKVILDRMDGKVDQKILNELSGELKMMGSIKIDGKPLVPNVGD